MRAKLASSPGEAWTYSNQAFAHPSLIFARAAGREMHDYMRERLFDVIGAESNFWAAQGGAGKMGPHTNAHSGLHLSPRDFARFGYLLAHREKWRGRQVVPEWWIDEATRSSRELNPDYGYAFWVNTKQRSWRGVPEDAFSFAGDLSNRCYVVPSLDLVVLRLGYSPIHWPEGSLLPAVVRAIVDQGDQWTAELREPAVCRIRAVPLPGTLLLQNLFGKASVSA